MTKITYIPGEIANAAIDEHGNRKPVTRTHHIFDDAKGKSQAEVNEAFSNAIGGLNSQNYVTVDNFNALPTTGEVDTVYRVSNWDGTQQDPAVYSEYAWNGSTYVKLSTKSQVGEVYDISANHADAKYADLAAALNGGANIPQSLRKGGMSIKFVQSSDNKYIQARCMAQNFTTDVTQWQGVDEEPLASSNLPKSGGVFTQNAKRYSLQPNKALFDYLPIINGHLSSDNKLINYDDGKCKLVDVSQNTSLKVKSGSATYVIFLKSLANPILPYTLDYCGNGRISLDINTETDLTIPNDAKFALIEIYYSGDIDISVFKIDNIDYIKSQEIYYKDGTVRQLSAGINIFSADNIKPYLFKMDGIPAQTGNLESDGRIVGVTSNAKYKIVPVYGGESLKLVSNYTTATRCLILSSIEYVDGQTPYYAGVFATGESRREGSVDITVPNDARYVVVQTTTYGGADSYPVRLLVNGIALVEDKDSIVGVDKSGDRVTRKMPLFTDYINQFSLGFELLDDFVGNVGGVNLEVTTYPKARYKKLIVFGGDVVTLTSEWCKIAILRSFPDTPPTANIALDWATGESRKQSSITDYVIPADATCMLLGVKDTDGNDYNYSSIIINGKEIVLSKAVAKNQGEDYKNRPLVVNNSGLVEPYLPYKKIFSSYIDSFVEDCIDLLTEPCICFPLITDTHYMAKDGQGNLRYQNFDQTIGIYAELKKRLPLDFSLCLGDIIDNNANHYTTEELYAQARYTTQKFGTLGMPYYPVIGNHDLRGDIFNLYDSYTKGVIWGGDINTSFYKDFDNVGIRLISIDVYHDFLTFVTPLLNTDKVVIIASHLSAISTQNYSGDTFTGASNLEQLLTAFKNNGGKLIQLFGHSHADYAFNTPTSPYLSICTGCGQFGKPNTSLPAYTGITNTLDGINAPDRTLNTISEELFDVVVVRPSLGKINMVRFGAGDSREFTF